MNILNFSKTFQHQPVFSILDIEKNFPNFERENLLNWQKKGFLIRVRNGFYSLTGEVKKTEQAYFLANKIYAPSYISMESALAYYHWIPEGVFTINSVSTAKTKIFDTLIGRFQYFNIKPSLFFGYQILSIDGRGYKMADPEKTLLDWIYFHPNTKTEPDFESFRFNFSQMKADLDWEKVERYNILFNSKAMTARLEIFKKTMNYAANF
jgi:predicted transcriptional regulator of viral defense system